MKNKMLVIVGAIVLLFVGLFFVNQYKNKQVIGEDNPYGKENLRQETIDQLNDPLYGNIILPDELDKLLADGEDVTVYYYSPACIHCQQATPVVVPITEELGIDMKKMNLLEFDLMGYYGLEGTPTIVHYENGKEVARLVGHVEEEEYRAFFDEYVLEK